jgi:hypothetical protein
MEPAPYIHKALNFSNTTPRNMIAEKIQEMQTNGFWICTHIMFPDGELIISFQKQVLSPPADGK